MEKKEKLTEEDIQKISTIELSKEYSRLDRLIETQEQKIELEIKKLLLEIVKYNMIRTELIYRIPTLINEPEFQERELNLDFEPSLQHKK